VRIGRTEGPTFGAALRDIVIRLNAVHQQVWLAMLRPMRDASRVVAALRSALFTRLDVLFEILALRYQQSVLARSDRRFANPTVCSGSAYNDFGLDGEMHWCLSNPPRWTAGGAQGFWGCWRRRSRRRPGSCVPWVSGSNERGHMADVSVWKFHAGLTASSIRHSSI
jgi:hypothetical protein